jgi:hypothetical protein
MLYVGCTLARYYNGQENPAHLWAADSVPMEETCQPNEFQYSFIGGFEIGNARILIQIQRR